MDLGRPEGRGLACAPEFARFRATLASCSQATRCGRLSLYLLSRWEGENENEVGRCKETGKIHVTVDLKYYRPTEVVRLSAASPLATPGRPSLDAAARPPSPTLGDLRP